MLRLHIDGRWEAADFVEVLSAVESLYYVAASPEFELPRDFHFADLPPRYSQSYADYLDEANRWRVQQARVFAPAKLRLRVARIEYASPGGIDLARLGQATEAIDRLVGRLIDFFHRPQNQEGERPSGGHRDGNPATEPIRLKIENARRLLELRRDFPDPEPQMLIPLIVRDQDKLSDRIAQGMITDERPDKT